MYFLKVGVHMFKHESVLKTETIDGLAIKPNGTYVDCTVGGAGHSEVIASKLTDNGLLVAFDQDLDALSAAKQKLEPYSERCIFVHSNFRYLKKELEALNITQVDGILFDLGV